MSMLPQLTEIRCGEGKTKQKTGMEHDINKLVAKFKKTGQMPSLQFDGVKLTDGDNVIDLTQVGDFQDCQNRIAHANEEFHRLPSQLRRRFNNSAEQYTDFMSDIKNNIAEAEKLGIVTVTKIKEPKPEPKTETPK
ncbi:MAG: internal scaffolding protein [Arizlama microvirus]|nr:MAG: internal scaffolding protein [Arizlama microvirus]